MKMLSSALAVALLILSLTSGSSAQSLSNIPGAFSEAGFGVRPSGMGQAFTAVSNDANAFLTNPAGLLLARRPNFTANYADLFGLVPSGYFGVSYPLNDRYSLGGGYLFIGDDALLENTIGVSLAFSLPNVPVGPNEIYFDQMSFGITVKGRWTSFGNNANGGENQVTGDGKGFSIDFGYILIVNERFTFGLMLRDLIAHFKWDSSVSGSYSEDVPPTMRFGGAYRLNGLTIAFDLRKNLHDDTNNRVYFGAEKTFFEMLTLRSGFSNNLGTSEDLNRRWSFGMSMFPNLANSYRVGLSAAYRVGNIENLVRFGLDVSWGGEKDKPPAGRVY